jgi:hypothetical protein
MPHLVFKIVAEDPQEQHVAPPDASSLHAGTSRSRAVSSPSPDDPAPGQGPIARTRSSVPSETSVFDGKYHRKTSTLIAISVKVTKGVLARGVVVADRKHGSHPFRSAWGRQASATAARSWALPPEAVVSMQRCRSSTTWPGPAPDQRQDRPRPGGQRLGIGPAGLGLAPPDRAGEALQCRQRFGGRPGASTAWPPSLRTASACSSAALPGRAQGTEAARAEQASAGSIRRSVPACPRQSGRARARGRQAASASAPVPASSGRHRGRGG